MRKPNRFLQYALKPLLLASLVSLGEDNLAQNTPAVAAASSSSTSSQAMASAPPEKLLYIDNVERDNDLLAKAFTAIAKADELQWLETPDEKILALYKAGETRKTKGVLLIMHAPETPQLWPTHLDNLRRNLPISGWATMALPLPVKYPAIVPRRESASSISTAAEASSEAASSARALSESSSSARSSEEAQPVIARDKLIAGRVNAAIAQLNNIGQTNLVALVDNSGAPDALATIYATAHKTSTASDGKTGSLQALILVNLQDQEPLSRAQLSAIFAVGDLPVMDVFFNPDTKTQIALRRLHHAEAMRQHIKDYQQLMLPAQPTVNLDETQNFWLGKVHGFMTAKTKKSEAADKDKK